MKIRSPFVSNKKALNDMIHAAWSMVWGAISNRSKRDYSGPMNDPTGSSLIMAVLQWIARRWPEAPVTLKDPKGDMVKDHAMLSLMRRPNPYYSGASLWFGTILSFIWNGNAYWIKIKNRDLSVRELWYVPHFHIEPKVENGSPNFIDYYEYTPGGRASVKLMPDDVVHFRNGIDPFNPRKGLSPLCSIARDAVTDEEADNFAASMLLNMGVPGLIIAPDLAAGQSISDSDIDATKKYFDAQTTGDKRGRTMVMRGPTKVEQFGFDPKSMDLGAIRNIAEERVCAVTGVPAAVVGFGTGLQQTTVGATIETLREMAYEDAIIPIQRLIGAELETQLLPDFEPRPEQWAVGYDLSQVRVLQDDQDALYKRIDVAFNGGIINRAQAKQALGFEALPTDEIRRVPFSTIEIPDGREVVEYVEPEPTPAKSRHFERKGASRARAYYELQLRAGERLTAAYTSELIDSFEALGERVSAAYLAFADDSGLAARAPGHTKAEAIDPNSPEGIEIEAMARKVFTYATVAGPLSDALEWQGHYLSVAKTTVKNINAIFGAALDLPDLAQRAILAAGGKHIALVNIDKQVQDSIFAGIAKGRAEGLGPREVARAIRANVEGRDMFPGVFQEAFDRAKVRGWSDEKATMAGDRAARQYRAELISRTETKFAQNVSSLEVARESGTFNAMHITDGVYGPPRSDDECIARNNTDVSFDEAERIIVDEHPNGTASACPTIVEVML